MAAMPRPIKILFDANPLISGSKSGVGYYTYNLIEALAQNYPNELVLVGHYFNFLGQKKKLDLPKAKNIHYKQSVIIPGKALNLARKLNFQLPLELFFKQRGDVALFTNFVSLPSIFKTPTFVAIHDLCFFDVPQYVSKPNRVFLQKFVPRSVDSASKIITISNATKQAIQNKFNLDDERFVITPIPPAARHDGDASLLPQLGVKGKYILFVSTLEPRKNVINLVKAYEQLPKAIKDDFGLVLAGGEGWDMDETLKYIEGLKLAGNNIVTTGYISDAQKAALYTSATLFVMPSHYEGFGMPILEAMSYAVPTAISNIPVFHEVAGKASMFFDKDNPVAIASAIEKVLVSTNLQKELVAAGNELLDTYSWAEVSATLYEAVRSVVLSNK